MSGLFSECYSEQGTETPACTQNGCGLGSVASLALTPFADEIKKGILSASQSVLKQLRKKQQGGAGARRKPVKNKKQLGRGQKRQTKRKNKKQTGFGKKRSQQKGKGVKKQCRRYQVK